MDFSPFISEYGDSIFGLPSFLLSTIMGDSFNSNIDMRWLTIFKESINDISIVITYAHLVFYLLMLNFIF